MIPDIPDIDWILGPEVEASLRALETLGLTLDARFRPPHLPNLRRVLARHPGLRVVIDHGAKPEIAAGRLDPWGAEMRMLARETTVWVKLSGLVTEAGPDWSVDRLRPHVDHLLDHFGPNRLIFGSDWPVVTLVASYAEWLAATDALLAGLDSEARSRIMGWTRVSATASKRGPPRAAEAPTRRPGLGEARTVRVDPRAVDRQRRDPRFPQPTFSIRSPSASSSSSSP